MEEVQGKVEEEQAKVPVKEEKGRCWGSQA